MSVPTPDIIRTLRENHELKQKDLAKQLGVVQQTYSNYEKGHSAIPLEYIVELALFYEVSTDYLLGLTTLEKPAADMDKPYAQGKTLGEVLSAQVMLSPERRRQMLDYLGYLLTRQKEDAQKQKIKE